MSPIVIAQACIAVLLTVSILLQHRAAGLSVGASTDTSYVQRRGAEKLLYQLSIVLGFLFFALTILDWYV